MTSIYTGSLDNTILKFGFKVVTQELMSLGLRNNPTIYQYTPKEWLAMPQPQLVRGPEDYGGIWLCKRMGEARAIQRYMLSKHDARTRIFLAYAKDILFENNNRFKTDAVYLDEEIFD
jgi:hypothetical protein